jgi:hypothetical protein
VASATWVARPSAPLVRWLSSACQGNAVDPLGPDRTPGLRKARTRAQLVEKPIRRPSSMAESSWMNQGAGSGLAPRTMSQKHRYAWGRITSCNARQQVRPTPPALAGRQRGHCRALPPLVGPGGDTDGMGGAGAGGVRQRLCRVRHTPDGGSTAP